MRLRVILTLSIAILLLVGSADAYKKIKVFIPEAPEIDLQGVTKIAVLDFKSDDPSADKTGRYMADRMIEHFLNDSRGIHDVSGGFMRSNKDGRTLINGLSTRCFSVVERTHLESVLAEQRMNESGLINDGDAARIGQLLGAQVLLYGDVSDTWNDKKKKEKRTRNKQTYYVNCVTREVIVTASIRIVDTKTGEILGTKRLTKRAIDKACGNKALTDKSILASQCAEALAWEFVNMINPWYGYNSFELEKIKTNMYKQEADIAAKAAENLELDKAYAIYHKLYEEDSYNPKFLYNMGVIYEVAGSFELAQEMYEGAAMLKDEKKYKKAAEQINRRVALVPFYESLKMAIVPFDFEGAAKNESLSAQKIKVRGKSSQRIGIYTNSSYSSDVVARVPGEVQLEIIDKIGKWYKVKLLGGKVGFIHEENTDS